MSLLFHADAGTFFDMPALRGEATAIVERSPLIRAAAQGDRQAARALHVGFWPFVREFELAIDQHAFARAPLMRKFAGGGRGQQARQAVQQKILSLAHAVREMKDEEGSHAAHWVKDAQQLGLESLAAPSLPAMTTLVDSAYTTDRVEFFGVLAGTEFVAEELSRYLVDSPAFTQLFERQRWMWGEIHLMPHDDGPSHLEIDMDLARAYSADDDEAKLRVTAAVKATIDRFETAAFAVFDELSQTRGDRTRAA